MVAALCMGVVHLNLCLNTDLLPTLLTHIQPCLSKHLPALLISILLSHLHLHMQPPCPSATSHLVLLNHCASSTSRPAQRCVGFFGKGGAGGGCKGLEECEHSRYPYVILGYRGICFHRFCRRMWAPFIHNNRLLLFIHSFQTVSRGRHTSRVCLFNRHWPGCICHPAPCQRHFRGEGGSWCSLQLACVYVRGGATACNQHAVTRVAMWAPPGLDM